MRHLKPCARGAAIIAAALLCGAALGQGVASAPSVEAGDFESGLASVYAAELEGQLTASGEPYAAGRTTAAHRTLPLGTRVRVTDPASGRTVVVVVNDRWGGGPGRVINLSRSAAEALGMGEATAMKVELTVVAVGDGRRMPPPEEDDPGLVRDPLPARLEATSADFTGNVMRCRNEADILGLKDAWHDRHVRACLARGGKGGR